MRPGPASGNWEALLPSVWRRPGREVPVDPLGLLPDVMDGTMSSRGAAALERLGQLKRPPLIDPDVPRHAPGADEECEMAEEAVEREGLQLAVRRMLRQLPSIERAVIRLRYGIGGEPLGVIETAERLGYSRTSIWAIERRALDRLAGGAAEAVAAGTGETEQLSA